jgi:hypothetical protein
MGDWQGEPGAAIEQSVDVGAGDLCDVGMLSTKLGKASAESGNVAVYGVDVGAVRDGRGGQAVRRVNGPCSCGRCAPRSNDTPPQPPPKMSSLVISLSAKGLTT